MNDALQRGAVGPVGNALVSVLLIEDDLVDEMATLRAIDRDAMPYCTEVARSVAQARELLARRAFDVILADYQLADGTSFDLMDAFAEQLVIFITAAWDEAAAAQALRLGVHDYLIKDAEHKYLLLLRYRIETALRQRRLARQLRTSEARLQAILDHAPASICAHDLSGRLLLSNRRHAELAVARPGPLPPPEPLQDPVESEETLAHRDGSEHTYLTVRFPMRDPEGRALAVGAISVDISARKQAELQIRNLAFFDPLTALPNRRMLLDRLQQAFATSARHGGHGAVFFIDLDHFKVLNDTLGHDHGDRLLIEVARRLQVCVRGEDTVARIGGDEFVVMTVGLSRAARTAASQAATVGQKILAAIGRPAQLGPHTRSVTPSVGVCLFRGRDVSQDEVLRRADMAMYRAKSAGRGTLRFFDPLMQAALDDQLALARDLQRALAEGQLSLHFQRQIDADRGTVGAEALLRWQHPTRGVLMPEQFIPLAEQNGLILPIGEWVIATACAQLGRWAGDPASRHLQLAVNVSARQFLQDGFAASVAAALQAHGADPAHLRLELREGMVQEHPADALAAMRALRTLGVSFAMDDFGINASSISHLRRLPLDQIKISQSLMPTLISDAHDDAVVRTIIGMARGLGLSTIAAGVETAQQWDRLIEMGCRLCQGYLFGAPVPLADFELQLQQQPLLAHPLQHPMPLLSMG
jgi:diguanylate cyclase (GGDEF)-like protein